MTIPASASFINRLEIRRIASVDIFRALTYLAMIFVNTVGGMDGIPVWLKHTRAGQDAMHFPDVVFPAFLFIVGMSIPFGLNSRIAKGDGFWGLQRYVAYRAIGLIVLGFFMVNAEDGFNAKAMGISIDTWSLLFYLAVGLVWGVFRLRNAMLQRAARLAGVALIFILAAAYKGGEDGHGWMTPQWWGILGLIGWSYLIACVGYQLSRGSIAALMAMVVACFGYYALAHSAEFQSRWISAWLPADIHAAHAAIVFCGTITALVFFDIERKASLMRRYREALMLALVLALAGWALHSVYIISKIRATPPWCLYSSAICVLLYCGFHWLVEVRDRTAWARPLDPASANPFMTYLLPFIIGSVLAVSGMSVPDFLRHGIAGLLYGLAFACGVVYLVHWLNKINFKLKL